MNYVNKHASDIFKYDMRVNSFVNDNNKEALIHPNAHSKQQLL